MKLKRIKIVPFFRGHPACVAIYTVGDWDCLLSDVSL